jgi:serine protease inhibitor
MKSFRLPMIWMLSFSMLTGCGGSGEENNQPPRELTRNEQALANASHVFGLKFFKEVVAQSDGSDVFVSPLSVSLALGMTYNGARAGTATEMAAALELGQMNQQEASEAYRDLIALLTGMDSKVAMEIANSIWYRDDFQVEAEFIDINQTCFDAQVTAMDFSDASAADTINAWVADKTHDKIDSIVDPPIDPMTVMFLINAVYFKGDWTWQFDKDDTTQGTFHAPNGDLTVSMMNLHSDELAYMENDVVQAIQLPYGQGYFKMTVLLPKAENDVDGVIAGLDADTWDAWLGQMSQQEGDLSLPKFKLSWGQDGAVSIKPMLQALGMELAFSGMADLSGIRQSGGLYISDVLHKTFVQVDEEGTEAAAVTSVEIRETSMADTYVMRVDRPFVFAIHDDHSGALMFIGKIVAPTWE